MADHPSAAPRFGWRLFILLVAAQGLCAVAMIALMIPSFEALATNAGRPLELTAEQAVFVPLLAIAIQAAYWFRHGFVDTALPLRNVVLAHVVTFFGRASFFFGGAMFSAVFFRHFPALERLPPGQSGLFKLAVLVIALFSLYCTSLELDRAGRSLGFRA